MDPVRRIQVFLLFLLLNFVAQNLSGTKTNNEILTFYFGYCSSVPVFLTPNLHQTIFKNAVSKTVDLYYIIFRNASQDD